MTAPTIIPAAPGYFLCEMKLSKDKDADGDSIVGGFTLTPIVAFAIDRSGGDPVVTPVPLNGGNEVLDPGLNTTRGTTWAVKAPDGRFYGGDNNEILTTDAEMIAAFQRWWKELLTGKVVTS